MRKLIVLLFTAIVLIMPLTACGDSKDREDRDLLTNYDFIEAYSFLPGLIDLPDLQSQVHGMLVHGDRIFFYYVEWSFDDTLMADGEDSDRDIWQPDPPTLVVMSISTDGGDLREIRIPAKSSFVNIADMRVTEMGDLGFALVCQDWDMLGTGAMMMVYAEYSMDGRELVYRELDIVPASIDGFSVEQVLFTNDGIMVITTMTQHSTTIYLSDTAGALFGRLELGSAVSQGITQLGDGRVVMLSWERVLDTPGAVLRVIDFEVGDWGETIPVTISGARNIFSAGESFPYDLLVYDDNYLFGYDLKTSERTLILNWVEVGITAGWDFQVIITNDGRIILLNSEWQDRGSGGIVWSTELTVLTQIQRSERPAFLDQTIITLGGPMISDEIRREVVAFNRDNLVYQIHIRDYLTPEDFRIGMMRFQVDLVTGRGPDIIVNGNPNVHWLFTNLYDFLDADPLLNRSDFFPNVLKSMETSEGKLPLITSTFGIETIYGMKEHVGHIESWTFAELLTLLEDTDLSHPLGIRLTGEHFIYLAIMFNRNFINFDENRASLDNQDFIYLLEVAERLPREVDWSLLIGHDWVRIRQGTQLLSLQYIESTQCYQEIIAALGDPVFLGMPTADGASHMIMSGGVIGTLGINAGSPHQEAAWSFIRQFMLPDAEMPIRNGFPLRIDLYDALIAEAMIPVIKQEGDRNPLYDGFEVGAEVPRHWIDVGDGRMIELFAMTVDEATGLRALIESADLGGSYFDYTVENIISEELPRFFSGDRTAVDTARIMQNRIQTYLNER